MPKRRKSKSVDAERFAAERHEVTKPGTPGGAGWSGYSTKRSVTRLSPEEQARSDARFRKIREQESPRTPEPPTIPNTASYIRCEPSRAGYPAGKSVEWECEMRSAGKTLSGTFTTVRFTGGPVTLGSRMDVSASGNLRLRHTGRTLECEIVPLPPSKAKKK